MTPLLLPHGTKLPDSLQWRIISDDGKSISVLPSDLNQSVAETDAIALLSELFRSEDESSGNTTQLYGKPEQLPSNLAGAKPRYGFKNRLFELRFERGIDLAYYICGSKKKSKHEKAYHDWLLSIVPDIRTTDIKVTAQRLRDYLREEAKTAKGDVLTVPADWEKTLDEDAAIVKSYAADFAVEDRAIAAPVRKSGSVLKAMDGEQAVRFFVAVKSSEVASICKARQLSDKSVALSSTPAGARKLSCQNGMINGRIAKYREDQPRDKDGKWTDGGAQSSDNRPTTAANRQINTPEFKAWFGGSKVVDADGKPLVVWRGDKTKGVTVFSRGVTWFSDNPNYAKAVGFGGETRSFYLKSENLLDATEEGNVNAVYDWAEGYRHPDHDSGTMADAVLAGDLYKLGGGKAQQSLIEYAKKNGYDGIKWRENVDNGTNYVVFSPNQVKLADGNSGKFDPREKDITKSVTDDNGFVVLECIVRKSELGQPLDNLSVNQGRFYSIHKTADGDVVKVHEVGKDALLRLSAITIRPFAGKVMGEIDISPDRLAEDLAKASDWDESKHPRDRGGKFSEKDGVSAGGEKAAQVESPAFKAWFGASRIVNPDGTPKVVYHGTKSPDITRFRQGYGGIIYFTDDPQYASGFSESWNRKGEPSNVLPVYLSMQRPLDMTEYKLDRIPPQEMRKWLENAGVKTAGIDMGVDPRPVWIYMRRYDGLLEAIKDAGYDGIKQWEDAVLRTEPNQEPEQYPTLRAEAYGVFSPNQIKSAIGNQGTFYAHDSDITKSDADLIAKYSEDQPRDELGRWTEGGGGIVAYHGTPHMVPEFSTKHIGSGEGAQSYGYGLYFAEAPAVAESYKQTTAYDLSSPDGFNIKVPHDDAYEVLKAAGGDYRKAYDELQRRMFGGEIKQKQAKEIADKLQEWQNRNLEFHGVEGNVYQVRIDVKPEELIDWDAPLKDQPRLLKAIRENVPGFTQMEYLIEHNGERPGEAARLVGINSLYARDPAGGMGYEMLADKIGSAKASALLNEKYGYAGIRYLDQGSRTGASVYDAQQALDAAEKSGNKASIKAAKQKLEDAWKLPDKKTYNLVIFDDSRIHITHVNGKNLTKDESIAKTREWREELHPRGERGRFTEADGVDGEPKEVVWHRERVEVAMTTMRDAIDGWWGDKTESERNNGKADARKLFDSMSAEAVRRWNKNVKAVAMHGSIESLNNVINDIAGEKGSGSCAGAWVATRGDVKGNLHLDGGVNGIAAIEFWAHEFAHAIDGEPTWTETVNDGIMHYGGGRLSDSYDWHEAWQSEINKPDCPLNAYAKKNQREGFAEYGRMLWMIPKEAREFFPKCYAVWKKAKLV